MLSWTMFQDWYDFVNKTINNVFVKRAFSQRAAMLAEPVSQVSPEVPRRAGAPLGSAGGPGQWKLPRSSPITHHNPYMPHSAQKSPLRQNLLL